MLVPFWEEYKALRNLQSVSAAYVEAEVHIDTVKCFDGCLLTAWAGRQLFSGPIAEAGKT